MRMLILAVGLSPVLFAATIYSAKVLQDSVIFQSEAPVSAFSAVPAVTTTPLDVQPETILVGEGSEGDLCTVSVASQVLPELKKMGLDDWLHECSQELEDTNL